MGEIESLHGATALGRWWNPPTIVTANNDIDRLKKSNPV
jgi:hypothetical protein